MEAIDLITDYSRTQRVVLLIDLNPLLHLKHPNQSSYLTSLLSTAKTLLSFPPLSSSLCSFKPFFSSLSPLLSSSKLSIPSLSLSFNHPIPTLDSLTSLLSNPIDTTPPPIPSLSPRALHLAASMRQILHDYAWDSVISDSVSGTVSNCDSCSVKSNLVILFSPIVRSFNCLADFFDLGPDDECLRNKEGEFVIKFRKTFGSVNEAFVNRDIHFSWVEIKYEIGCDAESERCDIGVESELCFGFFEKGIRDLGWGFCSNEAIVLGSALVPFGLIYPRIGISPRFLDLDHSCRNVCAQLTLEIVDVSGKPLECKCCDVELVNLNMLSAISLKFVDMQTDRREHRKTFWGDFGCGITKLQVKAVQKHDNCVKFEGSDPILVRELSADSGKGRKESCSEFYGDRVLEILGMEMAELARRQSVPMWEMFISFLYREDYWALVSLSNGNGSSLTGFLKPFTISSALLSIIRDQFNSECIINEFDGAGLGQFVIKTDTEICKPKFDFSSSFRLASSQSGPSPSYKQAEAGDGERKKKKKKKSNMLQELTWSAFCKEALEDFHIDLEDVYFANGCRKSKKLKFLKCWMKQIKQSNYCSLTIPERSKLHQDLTKLPQESEQPIASCSSVGEDSLTGASRVQDEVVLGFCSDSLESFFNDVPHKIQQGLESEEVDLGSLANRLVNSSIYWLYQKHENLVKSVDPSTNIIAVELTKILLRDPKDLAAMYRNSDPSWHTSNQSATAVTSENIVRHYELQILFRMEILQSEVGASLEDSAKQKFVKQICLLLETIQCHLQGGFFGDWSLHKYVGKIIKSRYCQCLGDVVERIYAKMDLLLFDEDETPNPLLNSEDSNQYWREKHKADEMDENNRNNDPASAEAESFQMVENENLSSQMMNQEEHARKLIEAQERRQRARRFASFTSWVPDLQRVWAPKQPKAMKVKSDPLRKLLKRREQRRVSYDTICETPMTGKMRSCRGGSSNEKDHQGNGTASCGSISKALFQHD